jgi:hypothetical protein
MVISVCSGLLFVSFFAIQSNSTAKATVVSSLLTVDVIDRITGKALGYYTPEQAAQARS